MTLWFLARAAGFTALAAATAAICLGAWASGARAGRRVEGRESRLLLQLAHRSAAVITLALLALHAVLLVLDSHVAISLPGALVPFTAGYRGRAVGLGTLAAYCLLVVALVGALRGRITGSPRAVRWWRPVHAVAYAVWPLSIAHGVWSGTDTRAWWALTLYAASAVAVLAALWSRLAAEEEHLAMPLASARQVLEGAGSGR
jgi:methionine sulfoxide reductase heme-binding subunit